MIDYSAQRKAAIAAGSCPEWYTTGGFQLFMEKYSWKGETVRSRFQSLSRAMALHAPKEYPEWWGSDPYTKGRDWEDVFFFAMWDGFISPSTPLLANGGLRQRGTTVSCLTGEMPINTKHNGMKYIKDIVKGDEVLTHEGRWRAVTATQSRMSHNDLYELKVDTRATPIKITGNHPVLTNLGWVKVEDLNPHIHLIASNSSLKYEELQASIKVADSNYNGTVKHGTSVQLPEEVAVDGELAWALGLWFAEGSLNRAKDGTGPYGRVLRVTMAQHEVETLTKFGEVFKQKFGVGYRVAMSEHEGNKWATCTVNSVYLANYFGEFFGTSCLTKTIPRQFIDMEVGNVLNFLKGVYEGDGRKSCGDKVVTPDIRLHNPQLISQLYEMSLKVGLKTSLRLNIKDGRNKKNPYSYLAFFGGGFFEDRKSTRFNVHGIQFGDHRYCKFLLKELHEDERVYDITVDEDESFSVAGVVVHNCAGGNVGDNLFDRYNAITEAAILTKHSHGTSYSIDDWPAEGDLLKRGGRSLGVMPVIRDMINAMEEVTQGARRGSLAYSIRPQHGDFDSVLAHLYERTESNNVGWLIDDDFIQRMATDDEIANKFGKLLGVKLPRGKGYFTFIDKMNRHLAHAFKRLGLRVNASNLCVAPETQILTSKGHFPIAELEGESVSVWNGKEWSDTVVVKTGVGQPVVTVETDFGHKLDCTPYHKFYTQPDYSGRVVEKRAYELKAGDRLIKFDLPVIEGSSVLDKAYTNGLFTGDGYTAKGNGHNFLHLYHGKRELAGLVEGVVSWSHNESVNRQTTRLTGMRDKFFVPDASYTIQSRLEWLAGWLDADGTVTKNGTNHSLQATSVELEFLREVQLMLQTLGVNSKVQFMAEAGMRSLPSNNGTGEYKDFMCQDAHRLLVSSNGLYKLSTLGLKTYRLKWDERLPQREAERFVTVKSVTDSGRVCNTYCFTEPKRNMGVFAGVLTGQCQETCLPSSTDYTFSCVILNYNLEVWDRWPEHLVFIGQVMSDCNISEYIAAMDEMSAMDKIAMTKIRKFTEDFRALGSGVLGWHTLMQRKRFSVSSLDCMFLNTKIFKHLDEESLAATQWLAGVLGEPEGCKGLGIRNATRLMMPPTKSTAELMAGASEGIGLDLAMVFTKQSAGGEFFRVNKVLLELIKDKGLDLDQCIKDINKDKGSVQFVDWLTDEEKAVFRTGFEVPMEDYLRLCSQRQRYIDQAQSINLYFTSNDSEEYIGRIHRMAFEDEGILSLYYIYSMRGSGRISRVEVCEACQ